MHIIQKNKRKSEIKRKNKIQNKNKRKNKMTNETKCVILKPVRRARNER